VALPLPNLQKPLLSLQPAKWTAGRSAGKAEEEKNPAGRTGSSVLQAGRRQGVLEVDRRDQRGGTTSLREKGIGRRGDRRTDRMTR